MFVHVFYKNDFVKTMKFDKNIRRLVLGREEDCDVSFGFDSLISRHHAGIILDEAGHYLIEDMGSKNGVYIGEKKIAQEKLSFDKRITLGNSSVIVSMSPFKEVKLEKSPSPRGRDATPLSIFLKKIALSYKKSSSLFCSKCFISSYFIIWNCIIKRY